MNATERASRVAPLVLLGPQRRSQQLGRVVGDLGLRGPFALISAGWRQAEGQDAAVHEALEPAEVINLRLYERAEGLIVDDADFAAAARERRAKLRALRDLYRLRLDAAMTVAQKLLAREGHPEIVDPERDSAFETIRALDRHRLARTAAVDTEFRHRANLDTHAALIEARAAIREQLSQCEAVLLAGGHVAVLLNRLRMFQLEPELLDRPVIAWSAGAMVACDAVVLFHDAPPQGPGFAELLGTGLALCRGVVVLPHARQRLRLDDPIRVALLARRFESSTLLPFDDDDRVDLRDGRWWPAPGTRALGPRGDVYPWEPA